MIFGKFFKENFNFSISEWSSPLPVKGGMAVIVLYCALNLLLPKCFTSLFVQLTAGAGSAFLVLCIFLRMTPGKISDLCSFRKIANGSTYKVGGALFLTLLFSFICFYWSCELFKFLGISVSKEQVLAGSLKNALLYEKIIIAFVTILLAPVGEEIIFRRMLYGILSPLGAVKALLLTSILFSVIHFYLAGMAGLFFFAIILQLLYMNTRNIWCPILLHMLFNALSFTSLLANQS